MRKSKFTYSLIMDDVKRIEAGFGVPDICRELGISTATLNKWRAKYGGMDVLMMSCIRELEEENLRLKKMYLEEKLKAEIVSEALEKNGEAIPTQRDSHKTVKERGTCIRVACQAFRISESC